MTVVAPIDWLILFATAGEGALVQSALRKLRRQRFGGIDFTLGTWPTARGGRLRLAVAATGIGQANAASAAGIGVAIFQPAALASIGVAGGYAGDGWQPTAVARGELAGLGDEGVMLGARWLDLSAIGIPLTGVAPQKPSRSTAWNRVDFNPAAATVGRSAGILTVTGCSGSQARARTMRARAARLAGGRRSLPWVEDMETAAIARVASRAGLPLLALRGISNRCGDRNKRRWVLAAAAEAAQVALAQALCGAAAPLAAGRGSALRHG